MTDTLGFSFDFDGSQYGFSGDLYTQEITPTSNGAPQLMTNVFTKTVTLGPLESVAFIVTPRTYDRYDVFIPLIATQ